MFNLDHSIAQWRQQLAANGSIHNLDLDELESHLRDEIDRQVGLGLSPESAFRSAVDQIGAPSQLQTEFAIARPRPGSRTVKALALTGAVLLSALIWSPFLSRQSPALLGVLAAAFLASLAFFWKRIAFEQRSFLEPNLSLLNATSLESLAAAQVEAPKLHHDFVGTEHLLLGLAVSAPETVRAFGLDAAGIRAEIQSLIGIGVRSDIKSPPLTPRARHALSLAIDEAKAMQQSTVAPEHILLGLLREPNGAAALILQSKGLQLDASRRQVQRRIREGS